MAKRGGRRAGAGRPKGSKSRFGNAPSTNLPIPELPPAVLAELPILETRLERQTWKSLNAAKVAETMEAKLTELEAKAHAVNDLRLVYQICELRLRYAVGTARPEPEPPTFELSRMIETVAVAVASDQAARGIRPLLPPGPTGNNRTAAQEFKTPSRSSADTSVSEGSPGAKFPPPGTPIGAVEPEVPDAVLRVIGPKPGATDPKLPLWLHNFRELTKPSLVERLTSEPIELGYDHEWD